jgi:hypothetical protein
MPDREYHTRPETAVELLAGVHTWVVEDSCTAHLHRGPNIQVVLQFRYQLAEPTDLLAREKSGERIDSLAGVMTQKSTCLGCGMFWYGWPEGTPSLRRFSNGHYGGGGDEGGVEGNRSGEDAYETYKRGRSTQRTMEKSMKAGLCVLPLCAEPATVTLEGLKFCAAHAEEYSRLQNLVREKEDEWSTQ